MLNRSFFAAALGGTLLMTLLGAESAHAACQGPLNLQAKSINGKPMDLCEYQGKVVLVVNTASYCGFTSQYEGLQKVYDQYKDKGLVVLGVPSNDFGAQEPGSNEQVKDFCERTYKVKFPMLEKTTVVGKDASPLYKQLTEATGQAPKWNFHKYLIGRDGKALAAFSSRVTPESKELVQAIEQQLGAQEKPKS